MQDVALAVMKNGVSALKTRRGAWRFVNAGIFAGTITFLALEGAVALTLAAMIFDYGLDRALGELRLVTGADAVLGLWRLFSDNMLTAAAGSVLIGVVAGLKAAGGVPPLRKLMLETPEIPARCHSKEERR